MAEKELEIKEKVEQSGIVDFPSLYRFAHTWYKQNEYGVNEEEYKEKINGNKKDLDIEWLCTKNASDYFKFEIKMKFEVRALAEVEVEIDGKKKKMNQGKVKVDISGTLIKDRESKWDTSPFNRFMRDVYNKYIIPSRVDQYKQEITNDVRNFKEEIKAFMELTGRR
jgi:hypothetical protein